ncbi:MAG: DEAD/DEAH box helicase [Brachymonas sp.]
MNDFTEEFKSISASNLVENNELPGVQSALDATDFVANEESPEESSEPNPFEQLGLSASLLKAIEGLGYKEPTAVQARVLPLAMTPPDAAGDEVINDLMVSSQTGSGKTAAFLLPILHRLDTEQRERDRLESLAWAQKLEEAKAAGQEAPKKPRRKNPTDPRNFKPATPLALILCPTRELAQQVANDAIDLVRHMSGVRIANVIGGLPYHLQIAKLQGANLVVATPGRLLDLQRNGQIKCEAVKCLVLDEADRMLDLGFSDDLAAIHQLTENREQTMMFSATFAPRIMELAKRVMRGNGQAAQRITIDSPQQKHVNITQKLFWADNLVHKRKLLDHWMRETSIVQAIVFASTQLECDALAQDLADSGFDAAALHGALSQGLRNRRLKMLRDGHIQFLVATDVAARGIDVPSISHVFNYGLPMKAEDYTHRIGRTGRAGRDGMAVTFAEPRDRFRIRDIEDYTKQPFRADVIPGLEPTERPREKKNPFGKFGGKGGGFAGRSDNRSFCGDRRGNSGGGFGARSGGFGGGNDRGFSGRSDNRSEGRGFGGNEQRHEQRNFAPRGEQRDQRDSVSFGGGSFGERSERGNGFAGNGFAGDKSFGKSFKPRSPSFGAGGSNGFADDKFPGKEGKSYAKPAGDFKGGFKDGFKSAPKPFAKTGIKPAGKSFARKATRKP